MASRYIKYDNVLLYLSDVAPHTVKAGKVVQYLGSIIVNVICIADVIHRLAEDIRTNFQGIKKLILNVKKNVFKSVI